MGISAQASKHRVTIEVMKTGFASLPLCIFALNLPQFSLLCVCFRAVRHLRESQTIVDWSVEGMAGVRYSLRNPALFHTG
jgi:hypothetical protein